MGHLTMWHSWCGENSVPGQSSLQTALSSYAEVNTLGSPGFLELYSRLAGHELPADAPVSAIYLC